MTTKKMQCAICDDDAQMETKTCVVCKTPTTRLMDTFSRRLACPVHRMVLICGEYKFVCDPCRTVGWVSTAGTGGGDHLYNIDLNVKIVNGKVLPYDAHVSDDDDDDSFIF